MRTSHRQIRKRILDAKSKISDEEFFSSRAYNGYLTDLAEAATKRYKRPLRVRVVADHDDDTVAFTDYHGIYINACNHITWSLPTRLLRSMSLEGFNAHECGHNLFTDNRIWNSYFSKLEKGKFYPKMPDGLDSMQKLHARDILEAVLDETDTVPYQVIMSVAHALQNILEDGYVDARYSYEFPGSPAKGIALNNLRFADTVPEISEMINRKYYDHSIVLNLLIQYIRAHEVNNLSGYTGEFIDKLYQYIPLVDECVYFTAAELTTTSFETYSDLDTLGRCGVTYACIGQDLMPTEERGSIGMVKPTGWHTVRYDDLVDGKYLYNRCHLIGYQLTGENANTKNLITGTRYLNIEGMLPFENMVADYIQETNNHVLYRVTPIFEGNNLLANGVLMEGYSVEDKGAGVSYCVFAYNVQPGIEINYATGESKLADGAQQEEQKTATVTPTPSPEPEKQEPVTRSEASQADYILNTNTKKFHYPTCSSVNDMKEKNRQEFFGTRDETIALGYSPCGRCKP